MLHRDWILKRWWTYAERAAARAGFPNPEYIFVGNPRVDFGTWSVIASIAKRSRVHRVITVEERDVDKREWNYDRFEHMAELRNYLLRIVRTIEPQYFLSLDSDILLHEGALANAFETLDRFEWGAVGLKAHLTERVSNTHCPSYAKLHNGGIRRQDTEAVFPCDVLMAIKLMTPAAYAINYKADPQGEDIGWSKNCHDAHVRLGFDGRICSKHVMKPEQLDVVDPRCGY